MSGLNEKDRVERTDGKKLEGPVIVLELRDSRTWEALERYADTLELSGNLEFATDVRRLLDEQQAHRRLLASTTVERQ